MVNELGSNWQSDTLQELETLISSEYQSVRSGGILPSIIVSSLIDIIIDLFKSCEMFTSADRVKEISQNPTYLQRFLLRRAIRKNIPNCNANEVENYYFTLVSLGQTAETDFIQKVMTLSRQMN